MSKRLGDALWMILVVSAMTAVLQELKKPASERTWHGKVFDFIPYDFRVPTCEAFQRSYWNPSDDRLFTERVLGLGWGVNVYQLWQRISGAFVTRPTG